MSTDMCGGGVCWPTLCNWTRELGVDGWLGDGRERVSCSDHSSEFLTDVSPACHVWKHARDMHQHSTIPQQEHSEDIVMHGYISFGLKYSLRRSLLATLSQSSYSRLSSAPT